MKKIALLWAILIFPAYFLSHQYISQNKIDLLHDQNQKLQNELLFWFKNYRSFPELLSGYQKIIDTATDPTVSSIKKINHFLEDLTESLDVNVIYMVDKNSIAIASSNHLESDSFIGKNYKFRPHIRKALEGTPSVFFAIGTISKKRGFYFSSPIVNGQQVVGATIIKISIDFLLNLDIDQNSELFLLDEDDVIFYSTLDNMTYRSLTSLKAEAQQRIKHNQRYLGKIIEPIFHQDVIHFGLTERLSYQHDESYVMLNKSKIAPLGASIASIIPYHVIREEVALILITFTVIFWLIAITVMFFNNRRKYLDHIQDMNESLEYRVTQLTKDLTNSNRELTHSLKHYKSAKNELEATQEELIQATKLAVIGEMSAGLNHELNQPLQALLSYTQNCNRFLEKKNYDQISKNLKEMQMIAITMGNTIAKFKVFARKANPEPRYSDIAEVIKNAMAIITPLAQQINSKILVHYKFSGHCLKPVWCEPVMTSQVLVNLLSNALQAMETKKASPEINIKVDQNNLETRIEIEDNGPGISSKILGKIFTPFFTTKDKGLGLGLALSKRMIEAQKGQLFAKPGEVCGMTFILILNNQYDGQSE